MDYTPVIIDGKMIESLKQLNSSRLILVSGRYLDRQKEQVVRIISPYLTIDQIYFRENPREAEWKFKERILRKEKVDIFIEDREFVVRYLRTKGINAVHIRKVQG